MYRYLPISAENATNLHMHGANAIYIYRTREIYENVIYWWVICALTKDCMAPTTDLYCHFKGRNVYANCHRYDQSAINIVAAHHFEYDEHVYLSSAKILTVNRHSKHHEQLWTCTTRVDVAKVQSKSIFS